MNTQDRAHSYAEAFYEAAWERWLAALEAAAAKMAQDQQLLDRAQAAQIEFSARQPLLDSILPTETDLPVRNLLYTLAQHGDLGLLPDLNAALRSRIMLAGETATRVEVVSAVPLTQEETAALIAKLTTQYGRGLEFHYRVDPAILGGLVVRVGDKLIDGSLATRLAAMKQTLGVTTGD